MAERRIVPKPRQCPLCYAGEMNGIGQCDGNYKKASTILRRYYRCDRCAHTWSADFSPEQLLEIHDDQQEANQS